MAINPVISAIGLARTLPELSYADLSLDRSAPRHRFVAPELLASLADDYRAPIPLCETFFLAWFQVMTSKFPADQHCPNCRSCDTNRSFRGGLGSSTAACASACRTREAIPKRMLTGEQPILKAFSGVPIAMEVMGGRPRSTTRWCMFTAMKGSISWCSRDAAKQISAVSQPSEQRIRQLEPKGAGLSSPSICYH